MNYNTENPEKMISIEKVPEDTEKIYFKQDEDRWNNASNTAKKLYKRDIAKRDLNEIFGKKKCTQQEFNNMTRMINSKIDEDFELVLVIIDNLKDNLC